MMKRKIILTIFITLLFTTCNIVYNVSASYHLRQLCVDTNGDTSTVCDSKYDMNEIFALINCTTSNLRE